MRDDGLFPSRSCINSEGIAGAVEFHVLKFNVEPSNGNDFSEVYVPSSTWPQF